MDEKSILHSVSNRRPNIPVLVVTLALLFVTGWLMPGLRQLLFPLVVLTVLIAIPLYVLRVWLNRRMLRSALDCLRRSGTDRPPTRQDWRLCLSTLDRFPRHDVLWCAGLWAVGLAGVLVILVVWVGMTNWQLIAITCLGASGAAVEGLLSFHSASQSIQAARHLAEEQMPPGAGGTVQPGSLPMKFLVAFFFLGLSVLALSTLVLDGQTRSHLAQRLLDESRDDFLAAVRQVEHGLSRSLQPQVLLARLKPGKLSGGTYLLFEHQGRIVGATEGASEQWLSRIVQGDAPDWLARQAPFLYHRHLVTPTTSLFWIGDLDLLLPWGHRPIGFALLAGGLMLLMGLVAAYSVTVSSLQPLRSLRGQVERLAIGQLDQNLEVGGSGEVAALAGSIGRFSKAVQRLLAAGQQAAKGMQEHHDRLVSRLEHMQQGSDHRGAIAERTATSVVQMRSSIQSISEQVDALRLAATDCSSTLFEIEQSVREVSASAENLNSLVDDNASATTEITRSMGEVSKRVDELAGKAEETDVSISAMGLAINQVEENASRTHRLTDEVSTIASHGAESVRETIAGIEETRRVTDDAREVINRLGGQMDAVGKILTVISDVAQQTNLLALNAAIIAAAAGEHGKGFAVVADEIKDLADRTATSTKEIAGLIKAVQAESRRAVEAIGRGSDSVKAGVKLANNAGDALQQILGSIGEVSRMANEIHQSTRHHSDLAIRISKSMGDMSTLLREIRRSMAEQNLGGSRINQISEQLREDAGFVVRSASEQVQAVSGVTQNMERISEMVGFVFKAIAEQSQGVGHVAKVAEEVRDASMQELAQIHDIQELADRIGRVTGEMAAQLTKLNVSEE